MELQGPQQTLHRGCLCEGPRREASFPAPGRGPASVPAGSSSPGAWGPWSELSLAGKRRSGGPAPAPWPLPAVCGASFTPAGQARSPQPPTPGRRPPAPRPWAQHAAACPADAGLSPGSRRDHCRPGARGHFLGPHSYSVVEPGHERTSASPTAPGGHRKGHVASIRRTSGQQWLGCGSSF